MKFEARVDLQTNGLTALTVAGVAIVGGILVAAPDPMPLYACLACAVSAAVLLCRPAHAVILGAVTFGVFQLSLLHPLHVGSASVYSTDALLVLLMIRGILPRPRYPLAPTTAWRRVCWAFGAFGVAFLIAGERGFAAGTSAPTIVRVALPVVYGGGYVWAFRRLMTEEGFRRQYALRGTVIVGIALILWMVFCRLTHRTFETPYQTEGHLGDVPLANGTTTRRDYGFASAFIAYPLLAVCAMAALDGSLRRARGAAAVAGVGAVATLMTLIRGEIFGLVAGIVIILLIPRVGSLRRSSRVRLVLHLATALTIGLAVLAVVSPALFEAVKERTLPWFEPQSTGANANTAYRFNALGLGIRVATAHPLGLGLISPDALLEQNVNLGYVEHSGAATLLVYAGWPALVCGLALIFALAHASLQLPASESYLRIGFVAALATLVVYSASAAGLAGQEWVIGFCALLVAFRFTDTGRCE